MFCKLLIFMSLLVSLSATQPTYDNVTKLYVATFNRAPDSAGLNYWINDSFGGHATLEQIAQSFFDQPETKALYPAGTSNRDFIRSVYINLFNREPDEQGWNYWEKELNEQRYSKNLFIQTVINGAQDSDDGLDATILENKKEAGLYFAMYGYDDKDLAKTAIRYITSDASTITQAQDTFYDGSGYSYDDACIVDFLYNDNTATTLCYEGVKKETCRQIKDSDNTAKWYGFPVKGDCIDLGYPESSQTLDNSGYVYYGMSGLYSDIGSSSKADGNINIDSSVVISKSGGQSKVSDLIFNIPSNAINNNTKLKVGKTASQDDNPISDEYVLTDVLDKLKKPITVSMPLKNNPSEGEVFFQYIPAKGGYSISSGDTPYIHMFDARVDGDHIVGDIYNFTNPNNAQSLDLGDLWGRIKDTLSPADNIKDIYSFLEAKAMHREKTADGQFEIYYPIDFAAFDSSALSLLEDVVEDGLNSATSKLKKLNFDWKALHKPIPVVLVKDTMMTKTTNKAEQTKPTKFVTNKYPMIKINISELKRAKNNAKITDEFRAAMGHEFFHSVQELYDPAWFNNGSNLFIAELSSVWFEYQMSTKPTLYDSDVANAYASFQNYGLDDKSFGKYSVWTAGNRVSNLQNLGYGASMFMLYVTIAKQNDQIMHDTWENYKNGNNAINSIDKAIKAQTSDDLRTMWRRFAIDYNTGFQNFAYKNYANWSAASPSKILDVAKTSSYDKNFAMPPYSAVSVYLGNTSEEDEFDVNATIKQSGGSLLDSDVYIYDAKTKERLMNGKLDGSVISFKMAKKPTSRSIIIINSGSEKIDVKLNIKAKNKKEANFSGSRDSTYKIKYSDLVVSTHVRWSFKSTTDMKLNEPIIYLDGKPVNVDDDGSVSLWFSTKWTSAMNPSGTFSLSMGGDISGPAPDGCTIGKPYYVLANSGSSGTFGGHEPTFNFQLDGNAVEGNYEFTSGGNTVFFSYHLKIPLICDEGTEVLFGPEIYMRIEN